MIQNENLSRLQSLLDKTADEVVAEALHLFWDFQTGAAFCLPTENAREAMIAGSLVFAERILNRLGVDVQLEARGDEVVVTQGGKSFSLQVPPQHTEIGEVH